MKILVFADLHYFGGTAKTFNTERKLVQFALPMLKALIKVAEEEKVDLAVNLGDLIQDDNDKQRDLDALAMLFDMLKGFSCPCYSVLGNHDLKMMDSLSEVECLTGQESTTFSMDLHGYHLVFLTTELRPELGRDRGGSYKTQYLAESTLRWLEKDLAKNTLPYFLFSHFSIAEDDRVTDECMFMKNREAVKKIVYADGRLQAVLAGHQHAPKTVDEGGVTHYIVGSPTTCFDGSGIPLGVYRMIETDGDRFTVEERRIVL